MKTEKQKWQIFTGRVLLVICSILTLWLVWQVLATNRSIKELKNGDYLKTYIDEELLAELAPYDIEVLPETGKKEYAKIINATITEGNVISALELELEDGKTLTVNTFKQTNILTEANVEEISLTELSEYEPAERSISGIRLKLKTISSEELGDGSVITSKLANASISGGKIQTGVIETSHLKNGIVTEVKIADGAVTTTKILNGTILREDLADQIVTNEKLADNAVTGDKIVNGTIENQDLADGSINNAKVADDANIDWNKISKIGSSIADLTSKNSSDVSITDYGNYFVATNVEDALTELARSEYLKVDASNGPVTGTLTMQNVTDAQELIVKAKTGQTANLQEWQDSSGTVLNAVDKSGNLAIGTNTTSDYKAYVSGSEKVTGRFTARNIDRWFMVPELYRTMTVRPLSVTVGGTPRGMTFDGNSIWVATGNDVKKIDVNSGQIVATITDATFSTTYMTLFDGNYLWVTNWNGNLVKIDIMTNLVLASYHITTSGGGIGGIGYDGSNLWVADINSDGSCVSNSSVYKINPADGSIVATVTVGTCPSYFAFGSSYLYVSNSLSNNISLISISSNSEIVRRPVGQNPQGMAFDGSNLWVANSGSGTYTKLSSTLSVYMDIPAGGDNPHGMVYDGKNVWAANGNNSLSVINPLTNAIIQTIDSLGTPQQIIFDGQAIWVGNSGSGQVTKYNNTASSGTTTTMRNVFYIGGATGSGMLNVASPDYFYDVILDNSGVLSSVAGEARNSGGTPFEFLKTTNSYLYVMRKVSFGTIYFNLQTKGSGLTLAAEYWNGTAWTALTITDGTTGLSNNGSITFSNLAANWAYTTVNGQAGYFVRIKTTSIQTTAPKAYTVVPSSRNALSVYGQYLDNYPAFSVNRDGLVSIGTSSPTAQFQINGVIDIPQSIIKGFSAQTANLTEWQNSSGVVLASINKDGGMVLNENSLDTDIRFESDNNQNMFFLDASADKIGIGTATPQATLDINGFLRLKNNNAEPIACSVEVESALAISSSYVMCICNGTSWLNVLDGSACVW
ncbi:MAG: hypothetical protein WCJ58_00560 [bacterium]